MWNKSKYSVTVPVLQGSFDPPIESRQKKLNHVVYPDVKPWAEKHANDHGKPFIKATMYRIWKFLTMLTPSWS